MVAFYELYQPSESVRWCACYWTQVVLYYRRPNDGDVQRRHSRQTSARQRPVSTGALATTTAAAAANTSQNSSPGINTRSNVSASTPSVPPPPPHGQPPQQGAVTDPMIS